MEGPMMRRQEAQGVPLRGASYIGGFSFESLLYLKAFGKQAFGIQGGPSERHSSLLLENLIRTLPGSRAFPPAKSKP